MLVIGNANPSHEMASPLASVASNSTVYKSCRVSIFSSLPDARIQDIGPITRYSTSTSDKVTVHIQDGSTIEDIDTVLFGTGYYPNVPYLQIVHPESCTLTPLTLRPHASPPASRRFQFPRPQPHTRVHGRNYIIHTLPSRRPHKCREYAQRREQRLILCFIVPVENTL